MSACIQTRGYFKVDVINEDMPTLRNLERGNLYRNYIWREVRIIMMLMMMIDDNDDDTNDDGRLAVSAPPGCGRRAMTWW